MLLESHDRLTSHPSTCLKAASDDYVENYWTDEMIRLMRLVKTDRGSIPDDTLRELANEANRVLKETDDSTVIVDDKVFQSMLPIMKNRYGTKTAWKDSARPGAMTEETETEIRQATNSDA